MSEQKNRGPLSPPPSFNFFAALSLLALSHRTGETGHTLIWAVATAYYGVCLVGYSIDRYIMRPEIYKDDHE